MSYNSFYRIKFLFIPFNVWPFLFYNESKWPFNEFGFFSTERMDNSPPNLKKCVFFSKITLDDLWPWKKKHFPPLGLVETFGIWLQTLEIINMLSFVLLQKYCKVVLATLILSIISFQHKMSYYTFYLNKFLFIPFNLWPCLFYTDSKWPLNELGFSGLKEWIICNSFKPFFKNAFFLQNCTWWPLTLKISLFHPSDWWKL